jgi:ribonuclease BN (tRNA processing enzyme)
MTIISPETTGSGKPESPHVFPLKNAGDLELTFIGAGSAFSKSFYQNNVLVVKGDTHFLVDCGSRTPEALARMGLSVMDIGTYLITHSHADHIGGLEEVMLVNRYVARKRPRIIVTDKLKRILWTMSLRGGTAWNEAKNGLPLVFEDYWEQVPPRRMAKGDREFSIVREGPVEIGLYRTKHVPDSAATWEDSFPSYGLLLDQRVLFTSDTRWDPELVLEMDRQYDLETVFHDCQFYRGGVHASLEELDGLPASIKAKTWLMHYGDTMEKERDHAAGLGFAGFAAQGATYRFEARVESPAK